MPVGDSSLYSGKSYLALGRETTYGTGVTTTAGIDFLSASLKLQKDSKILEQIERSRTMSKSIGLGKNVGGDIEFYPRPFETATAWILQNAFGGTITSATSTGESAGGAAISHTFEVGCTDQSYTSLSINLRKGPTSIGQIFEYSGLKVDSLGISGALDEPLKMTATLIGKDITSTTNDVESALTVTANEVLSFARGRVSIETTFASLTTTSFWHVQSVDFTLSNNLKSDTSARRIGSDVLSVLPIGVQNYDLSMGIRFDTTTAFDAMVAATDLSCQIEFDGATMASSVIREGFKLNMQKIRVKDAGDPDIGGPDEVLVSNVTFDVLRDESASGYAVQGVLTNTIADYS